jgi:ATP-dependent RNA helicase RhlE
LADIERLLKRKIEKKLESGFDVNPNIPAEPILNGRNAHSARPRQDRGPKLQSSPDSRRQNDSRHKSSKKPQFGQRFKSR